MPALLRSYSHFSLLSAVPKIKALVKAVKQAGYTGVALTDEDNGSGLVEFLSACKEVDLTPIFGTQLRITNLSEVDTKSGFKGSGQYTKIGLLAKNEIGRIALNELITRARIDFDKPKPYLPADVIGSYFSGGKSDLLVSICGNDSEIYGLLVKENYSQLKKTLQKYASCFGAENVVCELINQTYNTPSNTTQNWNVKLAAICDSLDMLYVASPAPRYLDRSDNEAFRAVLGIRDGVRLADVKLNRDYHLPDLDELKHEFEYLPNAVSNTDKILTQIDNTFSTKPVADIFPDFILPPGNDSAVTLEWETLIGFMTLFGSEQLTREEWRQRYPYEQIAELRELIQGMTVDTSLLHSYPKDYWDNKSAVDYLHRIDHELGIINSKGYSTYFLVVADFVQFARDSDIVVNTRGSGAGSLVAYLTGITIIDPLLYFIPFERFLNPLRPSTPDIDCDIADDRRDDIIKYVTDKYGAEKVCQIITYGTMLPRMVVRDVGRTLGVSYKKCDRIAKLIPLGKQGKKMNFDQAIAQSKELANVLAQDEDAQKIFEISRKLEGNYRHASVHAAGVIITPTRLTDFTPLQWDSDHAGIVCQFDMNSAEKVGIVKLDFLGIRNLSTLGNAMKLIEQRHQIKIDLTNLNLHSKKAFELLSKGRTMGIFQLSGGGITKFLIDLEPSSVEDLMAMVALYRPGPMANIPEYIKRKHNSKLIKYYVPQMEKWMSTSYGILVYQDDLLYTVIELAGYDWAEADTFRKGVGKKIQAVLDSQHTRFIEGCKSHSGLTEERAEFLWSLMVPFAAYGFNKAHAASYGMVSYWTAYMKGEYTVEFMTTLMTEESNNLDKVAAAIKECKELGIEVMPPDVNFSGDNFTIESKVQIRYGMGSIKNLGSDVIRFITQERDQNGRFTSIDNFLTRVSVFQGFNRRSLEALIWAGCLDDLGFQEVQQLGLGQKPAESIHFTKNQVYVVTRSLLGGNIDNIIEALTALKHHSQVESDSLFDTGGVIDAATSLVAWNSNFDLKSKQTVLMNENESLGIYISGNPLDDFGHIQEAIRQISGTENLHLGIIDKVKKIFTKTNALMFALQVTTPEANYEAVIFPKIALELSPRLEEKKTVWIKGKIDIGKGKKSMEIDEAGLKILEAEPVSDMVDESKEESVVEYEELPKILVDDLNNFEQGVTNLFAHGKDRLSNNAREVLEKLDWTQMALNPKMFQLDNQQNTNRKNSEAHIEDANTSFESQPANSLPSLPQPQLIEPKLLSISIEDGPKYLKQVKAQLQGEPMPGLFPVKLQIEVAPGEWKTSKKIFYIEPSFFPKQ